MSTIFRAASRVTSVPGLNIVSPSAASIPSGADLAGFLESQKLAKRGAREIAALLQEGWTETQTAKLLNTWLNDHGVQSWFHKAFVWFGERTRFDGVKSYWDYLPSKRVVRPGEVFILDVAPIVDGYICDIGYTSSLGSNPELDKAKEFMAKLRAEIPRLFETHAKGSSVWDGVNQIINDSGWENIHAKYPFSVLGHRVHRVKATWTETSFINFGWQSYWSFLSRGLFGQLLNENHVGAIDGLWAVEPHIGNAAFGAKFEELLLVDGGRAQWLESKYDL